MHTLREDALLLILKTIIIQIEKRYYMPHIIPSTDLRNNYAEVERLAKESKEPIYLTKNGRGSMVIMDIDAFEAYHTERAWRRYANKALAEAEENERRGASSYSTADFAFEKLLSEPLETEQASQKVD